MHQDKSHRRHDLHRFLTFVDACIAIAVTLLVLPLVEAAGDVEEGASLVDFFDANQSLFWSFLLSFGVIAQIWTGHHTYASLVASADRAFVSWMLGWTFCVVLLPVPTALISSYDADSGIVPLYIGLLLLNALCSAGMATHVARTPALWAPDVTRADVAPVGSWVMAGSYAVALVIGTAIPDVNFFALLVLVATGPVTAAVRRRLYG